MVPPNLGLVFPQKFSSFQWRLFLGWCLWGLTLVRKFSYCSLKPFSVLLRPLSSRSNPYILLRGQALAIILFYFILLVIGEKFSNSTFIFRHRLRPQYLSYNGNVFPWWMNETLFYMPIYEGKIFRPISFSIV